MIIFKSPGCIIKEYMELGITMRSIFKIHNYLPEVLTIDRAYPFRELFGLSTACALVTNFTKTACTFIDFVQAKQLGS